jgi:SAM-dependent methyltransferase
MMSICRICNYQLHKKIFHISDMPLTDDFIEVSGQTKKEYIRDIKIYHCGNCGINQNPDDFNHESYYQDYQYSTGHSEFTKRFMTAYAAATFEAFERTNNRAARSVLEVGSGDGQQLLSFKSLGVDILLGVEPSEYLAKIAENIGVKTVVDLFGTAMSSNIPSPVDICLSSYTFDHVRQPLDYLKAAHKLLVNGGILAFEIHDFGKIVERTEYCLFEHEHTIYLNDGDAKSLLEQTGFTLLSLNPLPPNLTRGNSLIVIAKKDGDFRLNFDAQKPCEKYELDDLQDRIMSTVERIDSWIRDLPKTEALVGFGAGGRGVMTVAALSENKRVKALLDSNYQSNKYLAPKTRIPIVGPDSWVQYKDAYCIVFSYGYFQEILENLTLVGFKKERIISLLDFYPKQRLVSN